LSITGVNSAVFGDINKVWWGIVSSINVQHYVEVYGDGAEISDNNVGPRKEAFGVIGSTQEEPAIRNFYWLLGNQSISYSALLPSEIATFTDIESFDGLIVWTKLGGYNSLAIRQFAQTHIVIADTRDFCRRIYPSLNNSLQIVNNNTVVYDIDWGNFRSGDQAEMRNETGNSNQLTAVLATSLKSFSNVTTIAHFDSSRTAFFHMNGTQPKSGFYVMDLDATAPETEWTGIWHVFPVVKMVQDFPTGRYARWMANGQSWWNLTWVYSRTDAIISENRDIAKKMVIGHSVQDRDIVAVSIGSGTSNVIMDGSIHGNEKTGTFACLRIAELIASYYLSDPGWKLALSEYTIIIIPVLNPDGFVANTRGNANGVDLNSQFPPDGITTEPEAWALRNLMGTYTPSVYINMHEGWYWYPSELLYGNYESGTGKTQTIDDMVHANETFASLQHWGWFTENGANVCIGKVNTIAHGGKLGMAIAYASYQYHASSMLIETFVWSQTYGPRKSLWGLDFYSAVTVAFLEHHFQTDKPTPSWDINQDGQVDMKEIAIVGSAFGSIPGLPNWNPQADINLDLKVDMRDITIVVIHFGEEYV
jgi:hypothetical protein